jgi:ParB-like chromosome segregation protein Spo0J
MLASSIRRFGWMNPIIVDQSGQIITGAGRFEAAKQLGMGKVPVMKVADLFEDEVRAYIIADNRLAQLSEWDDTLLADERDRG